METEKYRVEGTSLFEYDAESNAYIHCYRNDLLKTKEALIKAYEESHLMDFDE